MILKWVAKVKAYFDTGWNTLGYFRYLIALFGLSSLDVSTTLTLGFVYCFVCLFLGYWLFISGFIELQTEVYNEHNKFVRDMRRSIRTKKFK